MTVHERVERVIGDVFGLGHMTLTDETTPSEIPGWDSLGNINVMFGLEREFGVQFQDDEFVSVKSIGDLKDRLSRHGVG